MTDRPTVKINYLLDALLLGKKNLHQKYQPAIFQYLTKNFIPEHFTEMVRWTDKQF